MGKARTAKRATVSEDQDTEPRSWAEIPPEARGWVRGAIRSVIASQRTPGSLPGLAAISAGRIEAMYAALALLSDPPQLERPKRGKRGGASS